MNELSKLIENFGLARFGTIIGVSLGVAAAMALIIARIGTPQHSVLYADISYAQAQPVLDQLQQNGVDHSLRDHGARMSILVPRDKLAEIRLGLAADGVNIGEGVGYEIFDDNQTLGATTFQQNINRLRALEGELARTLSTMAGIRAARVHLVMPERELFSQDRESASASIVIDAPSGLPGRTVQAIINLTASAVPGLEPSRVTILDARGALLASGADADSDAALTGAIEDKKAAAQAKIRREVEQMIARIVGADNVRVEVAADMDFSRVTESAEIVDPDSQTVLSSTTVEETSNNVDPSINQGVSVANGLPGADQATAAGPPATNASQRTEETTNYEISKTVRNAVREEGLVIKRLSVAVAVNTIGENGTGARSDEELARLDTLVKSAIGFNAERGDRVNVVEIQFSPETPVAAIPLPVAPEASGNTASTIRIIEVAALSIIILGLAFFVIRPMLAPTPAVTADVAPQRLETISPASAALAANPAQANSSIVDPDQISGDLNASSPKRVAEIVKAHTDESAGILRGWMREAS